MMVRLYIRPYVLLPLLPLLLLLLLCTSLDAPRGWPAVGLLHTAAGDTPHGPARRYQIAA
jgi:hypothetical protein